MTAVKVGCKQSPYLYKMFLISKLIKYALKRICFGGVEVSLTALGAHQQRAALARRCACADSSAPQQPRPSAPRQTAGLCLSGIAYTPETNRVAHVSRDTHPCGLSSACSCFTYIFGFHDAKQGEKQGWEESCYSQWQHLCAPVHCHQDNHIGTFCLLHESKQTCEDISANTST